MNVAAPKLDLCAQFPTLNQMVNGRPLSYLDSAATTQRPLAVIEATDRYYRHENSNVHRGVHTLSQRATDAYERSRDTLANFVGAPNSECIVWTKGCTEAINIVANGLDLRGKTVLVSTLEHHSNIVPWQLAGAQLVPIPIDDDCNLDMAAFESLLSTSDVELVAVKHVCNAVGTVNPVDQLTRLAHQYGAKILIDGAQALAHEALNLRELDPDFYAMSAHKTYGPMGVGALYGRADLLDALPPYQGGGSMIQTVTFDKSTYAEVPAKFEAGTPNVAGVVAFRPALEFISSVGLPAINQHESAILAYGTELLESIPGVRIYGKAKHKASILSFTVDGIHAHDMGTILDQQGVAVRVGHHCCMPLMKRLGVPATVRASMAVYSTFQDLDALADGIRTAQKIFN